MFVKVTLCICFLIAHATARCQTGLSLYDQNVISLLDVFKRVPDALDKLDSAFRTQGWSYVVLTPELKELVPDAQAALEDFFTHPPDNADDYKLGSDFGYDDRPLKASLHYKTGTELRASSDSMPPSIRESVTALAASMDDALTKLVHAIAIPLFHKDPFHIAEAYDFPMFVMTPDDKPAKQRYSLFDVAWYKQVRDDYGTTTTRVLEHYDPGFISLAVLQTRFGLMLKEKSGTWVHAPEVGAYPGYCDYDVGVVWLGDAAL